MIDMKVTTVEEKTPVLVLPLFEGEKTHAHKTPYDALIGETLKMLMETEDFSAKKGSSYLAYTANKHMPRVLLLGLGKKKEFSLRDWKESVGAAIIAIQGKKQTAASIVMPDAVKEQLGLKVLGEHTAIAANQASYAFDDFKKEEARVAPMKKIILANIENKEKKQIEKGISAGTIIAEAMQKARVLGNTPPTVITPTYIAKEAQKAAKEIDGLTTTVLSRAEMKKLGMGCLLGVAQGSVEEPKFIVMEYWGTDKKKKPTVLVGKGITFDSGGLSLKPGSYMTDMKFDMLGAATAFGSIYAAAKLGVKKNVVAILPSCENMPGGASYRPDDILKAMHGQTVLVENTDAEGRLILADALCYAAKFNPKEVIDFATLTGACMVALGNERSGLFTDKDAIAEKLDASAKEMGEQLWRLPVGPEYSKAMECEVADIKNLGGVGHPRYGGASTAAAFLQFFTKDPKTGEANYPWAHIDLSCSYYGGKGKSWIRGGANGFGIQTIVAYLR